MTFVPKLYFSPLAVSLVSHIALEEAGVAYSLEPVLIREGQQRSERYLKINPLGRVPALEIAEGSVLTETPAVLAYVAELCPELQLLPVSGVERMRANEWMSLLSSVVHVAFISFFRPQRYTSDEGAAAQLKQDGKQHFQQMLRLIETRLPASGFVLGERYSLCDAYLLPFYLWGRHFELPVSELPRYGALVQRVLSRPAVRRALEQEGYGHVAA